jgi:membrane fusion protein, multidrug efflux system
LQKSQLETQHQVAQAQFQQQQITAPLNGQLVSLKVKTGDFLQPGQQIGEIRASEGAYIELELNPNQKAALNIGQILNITSPGQSFTGQVTNLAQLPSSQTEHYQAEISITNTTFPIHPGDLVEVQLPLSTSRSDTHLVPLDALLVRESGPVLISIQDDNTILENPVQIINYSQSFVEILTNLSKSMRVALSGHRLLTSGDQINY